MRVPMICFRHAPFSERKSLSIHNDTAAIFHCAQSSYLYNGVLVLSAVADVSSDVHFLQDNLIINN